MLDRAFPCTKTHSVTIFTLLHISNTQYLSSLMNGSVIMNVTLSFSAEPDFSSNASKPSE